MNHIIMPRNEERFAEQQQFRDRARKAREAGDRIAEAEAYDGLVEWSTHSKWGPADRIRLDASMFAGIAYGEARQWAKAKSRLIVGLSDRDPKSVSDGWKAVYWLVRACDETGDVRSAESVLATIDGKLSLSPGKNLTVSQLTSSGVSRRDIVKLWAGICYSVSTPEDSKEHAMWRAMMRSVPAKYPKNALINYCGIYRIPSINDKYHYAERAYRYGDAEMRADLLAGGSEGIYGANLAAKRMGHPYDPRYFTAKEMTVDNSSH